MRRKKRQSARLILCLIISAALLTAGGHILVVLHKIRLADERLMIARASLPLILYLAVLIATSSRNTAEKFQSSARKAGPDLILCCYQFVYALLSPSAQGERARFAGRLKAIPE